MTVKFDDFGHLNANIAFRVIERLKSAGIDAKFGASNVSESAYVNFDKYDAADDFEAEIKMRFAGHADRHGADITFRTDEIAAAIYTWHESGEPVAFDDDGEPVEWVMMPRSAPEGEKGEAADFSHIEIDETAMEQIINEAVAFARDHMEQVVL